MRSLSVKLILAFLIVSLTGTALAFVFSVIATRVQFNRFVEDQGREVFVDQFADYYQEKGEWTGIAEEAARYGQGGFGGPRPGGQRGGPPLTAGQSGPIALVDEKGQVVIPGLGHRLGSRVPQSMQDEGIPIEVDGREVGRLLLAGDVFRRGLLAAESLFLSRVNRLLILGTGGATILALVLGIILARTLTEPLRELTDATRAVAKGNLDQQVPVRSHDELGELAASFNQMNADLARSRDLRRQMTADIAHDLRTPLSVILGHAEALSEGVLPPNPETFHIVHDEARRLNRLVDDLRTLSLAEAGELGLTKRYTAPEQILRRAIVAHAPEAKRLNITLESNAAPDLPELYADPDRLAQVLDNLMANALQHTPAGGRITLSAVAAPGGVQIVVSDSGPGIAAEDLPYVFERFYRGDKARQTRLPSRHESGSGLGLAIARSIVEAHQGHISAHSEPGQGLEILLFMPSPSGAPAVH